MPSVTISSTLGQEKSSFAKIEPRCPYFGTCGGCALQDLAYADQLALKQRRLQRLLAPLGSMPNVSVMGLEEPWRYRNKAELTFGDTGGQLTLGYHVAGSFWRVVDVDDCLLLPEFVMRVLRDLRQLAADTGLPPYYIKTHQGFFRYVLVRTSHVTGRLLLCIMTTTGGRDVIESIACKLAGRYPLITSIYWGITNRIADVAIPEEITLLCGTPDFEDQLGPFTLHLHPLSFLQPTSMQADRMYRALITALRGTTPNIAWDLYCGVGLISFYLSAHVRHVYGIDIEPHHLELARRNAALNGLTNVEFRVGRVETVLLDRRFWLQEAKPDLVVVDPPRVGLHASTIASLLAGRPKHIAYFSCNTSSLVRDLRIILNSFPRYRIVTIQAFDMFPHTNHLETFVLLER